MSTETITLNSKQVTALKSLNSQFADIFKEDTAQPLPSDVELDSILGAMDDQAHAEGFAETKDWLRALIPDKGDIPIVIAGVGAASAGILAGLIQSKVSALAKVNPSWIGLAVGWLIYKWGGKVGRGMGSYVSGFGGGVVIGSIGALVYPYIASTLGGATQQTSASSSSDISSAF